MSALSIAASDPEIPGLRPVVPAAAFAQAGFDGFGRHGSFSVALADKTFAEPQPGLPSAEARLAVRAVICTLQGFGNGHQVVQFYVPGSRTPVDHLFGQVLPEPRRGVMDARCPRLTY